MNPTQIMPRQDTQYLDAHQDPWHYGALDHEIGGGLGQLVEFTDKNGVRRKAQIRPGNQTGRLRLHDPRITSDDKGKHTGYVRIDNILYHVSGDKKDVLEQVTDSEKLKLVTGNAGIKHFPTVDEYAAYLLDKNTKKPTGGSEITRTVKQMWTLNEGGASGTSVSSDNDVLTWLWKQPTIKTNTPSQIQRLAGFVREHLRGTVIGSFSSKIDYSPKPKKSGKPHPTNAELDWDAIWKKAEGPRPLPKTRPSTHATSTDGRSNAGESEKSYTSARSSRLKAGKKSQNVQSISDEHLQQWVKTGLTKLKKTSNLEALSKKIEELLHRLNKKSKPKVHKTVAPQSAPAAGRRRAKRAAKQSKEVNQLIPGFYGSSNYNPGSTPLLSMRYPGEGMRL